MLAQSNVNACTLDTGPPGLKQDRYMSAAWEFTQWANAVFLFFLRWGPITLRSTQSSLTSSSDYTQ